MKHKQIGVLACIGSLFAIGAHAQTNAAPSSVTVYGLVDTNLRYTTNEDAAGHHKYQLDTGGPIVGSRLGFRVREDLGGGMAAFATLEHGFDPGNGSALQGGRMWGRQSFVGLQGSLGQITAGRQYTIAHEMASSYDSMAIANSSILGFQSGFTGLRQDNLLRYSGTFGPVQVLAGWTFGEQSSSIKTNSTEGVAVAYTAGPLRIGGVAQRTYNVTNYLGTAAPSSQEDFYSIGGTYAIGTSKLYASYALHKMDVADNKDNLYTVGFNVPVSGPWTLIGNFNYDRMTRAGVSGKRATGGLVLDYAFSKSTSVYIESDYTKLSGSWMTVATSSGFGAPFFAGHDNRFGAGVGLRVRF